MDRQARPLCRAHSSLPHGLRTIDCTARGGSTGTTVSVAFSHEVAGLAGRVPVDRAYRSVDDPTKVLAAMYWPDAESCRAFSRHYEAEVDAALRPSITSHEPEDLWEEL